MFTLPTSPPFYFIIYKTFCQVKDKLDTLITIVIRCRPVAESSSTSSTGGYQMANGFEDMGVKDIAKATGLGDLPLKVRGPFAQALKAEGQGDHERAAERLGKAVEAEASL